VSLVCNIQLTEVIKKKMISFLHFSHNELGRIAYMQLRLPLHLKIITFSAASAAGGLASCGRVLRLSGNDPVGRATLLRFTDLSKLHDDVCRDPAPGCRRCSHRLPESDMRNVHLPGTEK